MSTEPNVPELSAVGVRRQWMLLKGFDEEEIAADIRDFPPVSVAEEMKELDAVRKLKIITPSNEELSKIAIKY